MTQTLIRKVLIRERELKSFRYRCLVRSEYGNKNLYNSLEWRPITVQDLTLEILKGEKIDLTWIKSYMREYTESMYDPRYYYWDYTIIDDTVMIRPNLGGVTYFEPFGWAVLKKHFDK